MSYVFPLVHRLEMEMHSEWGSVYPNVWRDARPNTLRGSFGFAMRTRLNGRPWGSAGLDFSDEAVRLRWSLGSAD